MDEEDADDLREMAMIANAAATPAKATLRFIQGATTRYIQTKGIAKAASWYIATDSSFVGHDDGG